MIGRSLSGKNVLDVKEFNKNDNDHDVPNLNKIKTHFVNLDFLADINLEAANFNADKFSCPSKSSCITDFNEDILTSVFGHFRPVRNRAYLNIFRKVHLSLFPEMQICRGAPSSS